MIERKKEREREKKRENALEQN